ncbi:MAG TPA: hypothetical protein VKY80_04280 [Croceibacterium sp.]|mgnify:CR=1 FL=1|jgi:hypothetical protein|nr:hypothetical protein [Croceibacterium sp.]
MPSPRSLLAALGAATLAVQPTVAQAQQARPCLTEQEVSAIAIYSVPSLIQAVRLRCNGELSATGYLARRGDTLSARYVALQPGVWPRAKSGLLKLFASRADGQGPETVSALPDEAVRPLVDALIVQETSPRIAVRNCTRIERVIEVMAPIDPDVAGNLIGLLVGFADSETLPVCPERRA